MLTAREAGSGSLHHPRRWLSGCQHRLFGQGLEASAITASAALSKATAVDSIKWWDGDTLITIQQHVLEFAIDVGTQYDTKNDFQDPVATTETNVFGGKLDRKPEWSRQRYPPIQLILRFEPKSPEYAAHPNPRKAQFAVAAVELFGIEYPNLDSQENQKASLRSDGGLGADAGLKRGMLLPLYKERSQIPSVAMGVGSYATGAQLDGKLDAYRELRNRTQLDVVNSGLFGQPRYSILRIANIGTWKEGNALVGTDLYAEAVRFWYALHVFVYGDWTARFNPISRVDELSKKEIQELHTKSLVDRVLSGLWNGLVPSFGLGDWGRVILLVLMLVLVAPILPVLWQLLLLVGRVLGWTGRLIRRSG